MSIGAFDQTWIDELSARKERIIGTGALDKVRELLASVHSHKQPILPIPLAFDRSVYEGLVAGGRHILSAQTKIVRHLCETRSHAEILQMFGVQAAAARFIDWDELLAARHSISRFDVVPGPSGFWFCELNRESAIGGQEVVDCLAVYSDALGWSLTDGWEAPQSSLVHLVSGVVNRKGLERVVVVDWSASRGTGAFGYDFLRDHLARALPGVDVHLVYEDEYAEAWFAPECGQKTLVYRGFMFNDMQDGGAFFDRLWESGATILNTFETEILANKAWFAIFCDARYQAFLSAAEVDAIRELIPHTVRLDQASLEGLLRDKEQWVFKGILSYGGLAVYLGADHDGATLREAIEATGPEHWIAQRRVDFQGLELPYDASFERLRHDLVLGLYLIDDRASGMNVRASRSSKIVNIQGGRAGWTWALPMEKAERDRRLAQIRLTDAAPAGEE